MKTIAFGTLKGGTGKTTTCFNLAGALAQNPNNKILLVDGDPQCNLTNDIGLDCSDMDRNNIRTIFDNKKINHQWRFRETAQYRYHSIQYPVDQD